MTQLDCWLVDFSCAWQCGRWLKGESIPENIAHTPQLILMHSFFGVTVFFVVVAPPSFSEHTAAFAHKFQFQSLCPLSEIEKQQKNKLYHFSCSYKRNVHICGIDIYILGQLDMWKRQMIKSDFFFKFNFNSLSRDKNK